MKAWKEIRALLIRTFVSTVLLTLLMYTFFACVDVETFTSVAEIATNDPEGTTLLFMPIVVMLCLTVMLCYLVVNPPKGDCATCAKNHGTKTETNEEKKPAAKKAPAKKATKTTKKTSKK